MNGRKAKQLRRQSKYVKEAIPKIVGDFNITINSGLAQRVINIPKTEPVEQTKEQLEAKTLYRKLKNQ
jgi:hypothetical protein